ncbi:MAG: ASPIC/UnbV domain-containing protein [Myxococcota bacterium]
MRNKEHWRGPHLRRWSRSGDVSISLSGSERNHLFLNDGGRFEDVSGISGLDSISDSRGFVLFDYDRDGWVDIAMVNTNAPLLNLFRNDFGSGPAGASGAIAVRFVGGNRAAQASDRYGNRDGYGAIVIAEVGGHSLIREHRAGEGYAAQNSKVMLIGLGSAGTARSVTVHWPSGITQIAEGVPAGTELVFHENAASAPGRVAVARRTYGAAGGGTVSPGPGRDQPEVGRLAIANHATVPEGPAAAAPATLRMYTTMATWCLACKRNIPQMISLRRAFPPELLRLYGVPIDAGDTREMLSEYVEKYRPSYALLSRLTAPEVSTVQQIVETKLGDEILPSSIVTDADGRILETIAGVPSVSLLRRLLRAEMDGGSVGGAGRSAAP